MTDYEFMYIHSLAENYLQYVLQVPAFESAPSKTSRVLQRVAFSVQKEVEKNLKPYLDDFHVESIDTARIIFNQVMEKEFEDGIINWGRIVTIFAFGGVLLKKLPQEQIALNVDTYKQVSSFVAEFIMNNTGEWIRQNGGWLRPYVVKMIEEVFEVILKQSQYCTPANGNHLFCQWETSKLIIKHETYGLITPELCLETLQEFQSKMWYRSTAEKGRTITPIKTGLASFQGSVLTIPVTGTTYEDGFTKKFEPKSGWLTFLQMTGKIWEMLFLLKQHY